jgi:hypothetical protein
MVAYVLVAKFAWHLPLYRQAQMLLAQGIDIKRAVLAFWVGYAAAELHPLWLRLREIILTAGKIAVDETTAPVLDPGRGRTKKGFFWAIARDDRPWGGTDPPAVAYTYAPGRGAVHGFPSICMRSFRLSLRSGGPGQVHQSSGAALRIGSNWREADTRQKLKVSTDQDVDPGVRIEGSRLRGDPIGEEERDQHRNACRARLPM